MVARSPSPMIRRPETKRATTAPANQAVPTSPAWVVDAVSAVIAQPDSVEVSM